MKQFTNGLLSASFLTDQNMIMIFISDEMHVVQLSASVLKNLKTLLEGSVVSNDLMLKILRKRGLYFTNAPDLRKALQKTITNSNMQT